MKIVFLDVDKVLQREEAELLFCNEPKLIAGLNKKFNIDYSIYPAYIVYNALYDWDPQAIARIKYVLNETESNIVVSSSWRDKDLPNKMRDLLTIHGLEKYYIGDTPIVPVKKNFTEDRLWEIHRAMGIYKPDNYVVIDDKQELRPYFPNHIVTPENLFSISDMNEAIRILKRK